MIKLWTNHVYITHMKYNTYCVWKIHHQYNTEWVKAEYAFCMVEKNTDFYFKQHASWSLSAIMMRKNKGHTNGTVGSQIIPICTHNDSTYRK